MIVIFKEPGKPACPKEIDNTFEACKHLVGGHIQSMNPFDDPVALICNERGKQLKLSANIMLGRKGQIIDIIAGPFFLVGVNDDEFVSLSDDLRDKYLAVLNTANKHPVYSWPIINI